jgi:hypothetical protein
METRYVYRILIDTTIRQYSGSPSLEGQNAARPGAPERLRIFPELPGNDTITFAFRKIFLSDTYIV